AVGGDRTAVAVQDTGEAVAALLAALSCAYTARRSHRRLARGWWLLAAAAASWSLGGWIWWTYDLVLRIAVPYPSFADISYLASVPLAVAGILAFPSTPRTAAHRWRAVTDGGTVAAAVIFVGWALGLSTSYLDTPLPLLSRIVVVAYPATDILLIALLAQLLLRTIGGLRSSAALLLLGYGLIFVADGSYTFLSLRGSYGLLGSLYNLGWVAGFLCFALAPRWPVRGARAAVEDDPVDVWQLAVPWLAIGAVILTVMWMGITGQAAGAALAVIGSALGLFFLSSQALALRDSLTLLGKSRRTEADLQARTALLNEVIGRAPLGIARLDADLRIKDSNPRLSSMLAMPASKLIGSLITDFMTAEDHRQATERQVRFRSGELESIEVDGEMARGDGTKIWVHRSISTVRKPNGAIDYFLVMYEDATARHEVEQAALTNVATLEKLNQLKSEFTSMVSHEFRTALVGIQGYSEMMSTEELTPAEVKQFSSDINSDALRLNRMITEMLDLDRMESGRMTLHLEAMNLNHLVEDAADRAQMTTSMHRVTTDLDSNLPLVDGDSDRLTQVMSNLLSNAIKYSPEGGEVLVKTRHEDGNVAVSVRDHGQGIPPEFIGRIFGRYERYDMGGKNQVGGTGLGLAIAQQILQLHKGRIWVESQTGEGSVFQFTIPAAAGAAPLPAASTKVEPAAA
ncbi:MAG TPA: ATP-binding protein, partial [Candidatus Dormibacteraeota bacterium]